MKNKNLLPIIILLLLFPFIVEGKEKCSIIGNDKFDIGTEVACGTEHFYVIENNKDNVKLLSKYNLYVGTILNKINIDMNKTYIKYKCESSNCNYLSGQTEYYFENEQVQNVNEWENRIKDKYDLDGLYTFLSNNGQPYSEGNFAIYDIVKGDPYTEGDNTYYRTTYKLYPYMTINEYTEGFALQNILALGVTGEKGNANYPIYATLPLFNDRDGSTEDYFDNLDVFEEGFTNFKFKSDTDVRNYLNAYYDNLENMGFDVLDVDIINMKELNDLVFALTNKNLPLNRWYGETFDDPGMEEDSTIYYFLGDLKEYVPNKYSWLWGTSYWTSTLGRFIGKNNEPTIENNVYFVSSAGEICFSLSKACSGVPRAGLRPVVTMEKNNIKFKIRTKTDGKGTIEVVNSAYGGDSISFRVYSKKGYKLSGLTVTTDSGEKVEFNEQDIKLDKNGLYRISTNKFTMPYENVTIEARWALDNPNTGIGNSIIIVIGISIIGGIIHLVLRKKHIKN